MKIEVVGNYPEEVKSYVQEYNAGVDHKDINIVGTAINSLVQLLFSAADMDRQAAMHALDQIGQIQPGFLKSAIKTLEIRYNGVDEQKKILAAAAIEGVFIGKKAEKLIEDANIISELRASVQKKAEAKAAEQARDDATIQQIQESQLDLSFINAFPEIKTIGQYYNSSVLNNNEEAALQAIESLINNIIGWYSSDKSKFYPANMLLGKIFSPSNRQSFLEKALPPLLEKYYKGKGNEKTAVEMLLELNIKEMSDILPEDLSGVIQAQAIRHEKEALDQKEERMKKAKMVQELKIPSNIGWADDVQKLVGFYNDAISSEDKQEKKLKQVNSSLSKLINDKDERTSKNAAEVLAILIGKNPSLVEDIVRSLLGKYNEPQNSEILGLMIPDLEKLEWCDKAVLQEIIEAKKIREAEELARKEKLQAEYDKFRELTILFDGDMGKELLKFGEKLNESILAKNEKAIRKLMESDLKKFIYAKDESIRKEGQIIFGRIAEKYPQFLDSLMEELKPLFLSDHEQRIIAVDLFGHVYDKGLGEKFFKEKYPEVFTALGEEWANRKQEIENQLLQTKFDAIKADVTQLRIKDDWHKSIQKIARSYNNGIKTKNGNEVIEAVKDIVDMVMNEKKEDLQDQANQVLGMIAKRNIELIQPTIDLFLQLLDGSNKDKKLRAIKGLGEVTRQRPGWAYMGIDKFSEMIVSDPDDEYRQKALLELGRIASSNSIMLIEHIDSIIKALSKDPNKHVRRLAAMALGNMAEAIPLEAQEAIPALTDALHDEYILVRKFADKALSAIRDAMRNA